MIHLQLIFCMFKCDSSNSNDDVGNSNDYDFAKDKMMCIINDIQKNCNVSVSVGLIGLNLSIKKPVNYWFEKANENIEIAKSKGGKQYHFSIISDR